MSISASYPTLRPTLLLDFANSGRLDPRVTFTRASTATYFDETGTLQSAAIDVPRFDYDPATLAARGFLVEEQRTNLLTYSEQFDDAAWTKANSTITADAVVAPDGTTTADKLVETAATSAHTVASANIAATNQTYTFSLFAKKAERTFIQLFGRRDTTNYNGVSVDLDTGAISAPTRPSTTNNASTTTVTNVGNGWWRIAMTYTYTTTGNTVVFAALGDATNTYSYTGDGTSGIYIWGAQLEAGAFPTSYIPTTTTALTRSADVASVNTLSPWFNGTEGTLYGEYQTFSAGTAQFGAAITSVSETDRITISQNTTTYVGTVVDTGVSQVSITQGATSTNIAKIALAYLVNNFAFSANGGVPVTDTTGTVPGNLTEMKLGRRGVSTSPLNGYLRRITYYPRRVSDAELQALTA